MNRPIRTLSLLILSLVLVLAAAPAARAAPLSQEEAQTPVYIYFFWGEGCPHCEQAKPFLENLASRYPQVTLLAFEVYHSPENQTLLREMAAAQGFEPRYVPTIFIGEEYWEGFADPLRTEIEAAVQACVEEGCPDAGAGIAPGHEPSASGPADGDEADPGETETASAEVPIYIFWGQGCPQCGTTKSHLEMASNLTQFGADGGEEALKFLRSLEAEHAEVAVHAYEVWGRGTYLPRFERMAAMFDMEPRGVPTIFVGDRVWEGFSPDTADEIETYVQECLETGCPDPGQAVDDPTPTPTATAAPEAAIDTLTPTTTPAAPPAATDSTPPTQVLTLPLLGTVNLGKESLWVSTALISFVDGFNPCSLWVLTILISLTLRTGSRKKVFLTGFIFLFVTSLIYVLFIAGLFTMFTFIGFMGWIQVIVALLALLFAAVNIKDYFWYKEGLSFTIADEQKPGLYKKMRKIMQADSLWALLTTTVVMSAGIAIVEIPCTAGFPVLWTSLVATQGADRITFVLLLALYMLIYLLDELGVFAVAVFTLKSSKLEEKHGRVLKLIGGMLMLILAGVMLIDPALMNELETSLLIFAGALVAALLVLVVHRHILPKLGIYVGTEMKASDKS
jgi:cytochrome c biogenesis protein CcdA/glutaredoxin